MIGRRQESKKLEELYEGGRAELVAIYGRRRVGKTYLVDEVFRDRITFRHAGLSPLDEPANGLLKAQLEQFYYSLLRHGMKRSHLPKSWLEAFFMLESLLEGLDDGSRQVVFLDELPWLDTPRSGFVRAFEGFWNGWGCSRKNLMVIVCGSATSWIEDKLINAHGGLYGRLTHEFKLSPFTLHECEEFFAAKDMQLTRYEIAQAYMAVGGIPYYLGYFERGLSVAQSIDRLFFSRGAFLAREFDRLFASVFDKPAQVVAIVRMLYTRRRGYTRNEMSLKLGTANSGHLSKHLRALVASDFVERYVPFGYGAREEHYRLTDPFCLFYLHFVDNASGAGDHFWQENIDARPVVAWRGLAFENLCFNHVEQLKRALGVSGVRSTCAAWEVRDKGSNAQVDLLLQRADNIANACECKFYGDEFTVDKKYYQTLLARREALAQALSRKISVQLTLITTFGLKRNQHAWAFTNTITLEDLFAE
ncbi:MAG: ATP-binding protein [Coriobacteriales bacterium]|nr:ATP-binding protein [Coriobacteriales bacterium]